MSDRRVLAALRQQAWERAKAELISVACASYGDDAGAGERGATFLEEANAFIKNIEDEGLHE